MGEGEERGREKSGGKKEVKIREKEGEEGNKREREEGKGGTIEGGKGAVYFYSQSIKHGWFVSSSHNHDFSEVCLA